MNEQTETCAPPCSKRAGVLRRSRVRGLGVRVGTRCAKGRVCLVAALSLRTSAAERFQDTFRARSHREWLLPSFCTARTRNAGTRSFERTLSRVRRIGDREDERLFREVEKRRRVEGVDVGPDNLLERRIRESRDMGELIHGGRPSLGATRRWWRCAS